MTTRHNHRHAPSSPVLAEVSISDFIGRALSNKVRVASPDAFELRGRLVRDGVSITSDKAGRFVVDGLDASEIGENAAAHGVRPHELTGSSSITTAGSAGSAEAIPSRWPMPARTTPPASASPR